MQSDSAQPRSSSIFTPPLIKVLVVEDNLTNQKVILRQLQSLGYQADLATSGQAALDLTAQTFYHLVLMDCRLPGMDGYTAARLIRQRDVSQPNATVIIALTASDEPQAQTDAFAAGMNDFLTKPLRRELLAERLEYWSKRFLLAPFKPQLQPEATALYSILRELQFDLEQLQQLSGYSLEFERELLQLYLSDLQAQLTQLQQAILAELWPEIEQIAHHIKGASASVGDIQTSQLAGALEQQARQVNQREQDKPLAKQPLSEAQALLRALVCEFERIQCMVPALEPDHS